MRRLVGNLVDNAVRHAPPGSAVSVDLERRSSAYAISVTDRGAGMPPDVQTRIFERFYRADDRLTRTADGCGLGLSIVQSIVEAHRGSVRVASEAGRGSTFTIEIPAAP